MTNSSFISGILYLPQGSGKGYLAVFFKPQPKVNGVPSSDPSATLYADIPYWLVGLLQSGSVGMAYHRLLRGKYPSQSIKGEADVNELRTLMERKSQ